MNASTHLCPIDGEKRGGPALAMLAKTILARMSAWGATCADYFAAAATYERLSALSDQELLRRGFTRATLARDVCEALDGSRPQSYRHPAYKSFD